MLSQVGRELTTEQGYDAAKVVMLNILATVKSEATTWGRLVQRYSCAEPLSCNAAEIGDLDKVKKFVKLTAFVNWWVSRSGWRRESRVLPTLSSVPWLSPVQH